MYSKDWRLEVTQGYKVVEMERRDKLETYCSQVPGTTVNALGHFNLIHACNLFYRYYCLPWQMEHEDL